MHLKTTLAGIFAVALLSGIALAQAPAPSPAQAASPVTVPLKAQNNSGETGTATLTQTTKGVDVVVSLQNAPAAAQPIHIHQGTCTKLNPTPKYPLTNVTNGKSTTHLPGLTLADLSGGKYSINAHKSTNDIATYVACGTIQ
jgi:Cu/Zn superoxide dismutase